MTLSKSQLSGGLFEILKMFYPPEGLCGAEPERGPIVFTYVLFWVRKRIFRLSKFSKYALKKV